MGGGGGGMNKDLLLQHDSRYVEGEKCTNIFYIVLQMFHGKNCPNIFCDVI